MSLPTLDAFLSARFPLNNYIEHEGFENLYVRKGKIFLKLDCGSYWCEPVLQVAAVSAIEPGNGAFTRLVEELIGRDLAIYVEQVHNPRFAEKLLLLGFVAVNKDGGRNFVLNHENKLSQNL